MWAGSLSFPWVAMRISSVLSRALAVGVLAASAWLAACSTETETKTVYVDPPRFNAPPDTVNGFLGYYDVAAGQTTCGNCHVDHQADWSNHGHAQAWASLQNSGHAASYCVGCHSVSNLGNAVDSAAGYNLVPDSAYYDVQCESCHGPGFDHVSTPDASAPPLASANADTGAAANGTCGECHEGTHEPYASQWKSSRHGAANTHASTNASCQPCHEGRGTLKAWGVTDNYIERNQVVDTLNALGTTCAVCHDPHGSQNEGQLRFSISDPSLESNLCMKCHARRFELTAAGSSPHGPQGPVLLGTGGWWPAGYDTTPAPSTHGDPAFNTRLCAGCHVTRITVNDTAGAFAYQSVGHNFRPIPCVDANGIPLPGSSNSCAYNTVERNWSSCVSSGCHADANAASQALAASRAVTKALVDQLWTDVDADQAIDSATDGGYLSKVAKAEFKNNDNLITVAEGAKFNAQLFGEGLTAHPDHSFGAHNPFLTQRILAATITAMKAQYPFLPAPPASVQSLVNKALAKGATPASLARH